MSTRGLADYEKIIKTTLAEYGVQGYRLVHGSKHIRCYFSIPGVVGERFTVLPSSPGTGNNGPKNHRNDIRKLMNSLGVLSLKAKQKGCRIDHAGYVGKCPGCGAALPNIFGGAE